MNYDWPTFFASIGGSAGVIALSFFIVKKWLTSKIEADVKHKYKSMLEDIKTENQKELEGFKAGYKKVLDENQIRFSKLYAEQAEVIKELYKRLVMLNNSLIELTAILKRVPVDKDEKTEYFKKLHENVAVAHDDSFNYFSANEILLPANLCTVVKSFIKESRNIFYDYQEGESTRDRLDIHKKVTTDLEKILKQLQTQFRAILNGKDVNFEEVQDV